MNARKKLNSIHLAISLGVAGFLGAVFGSWIVFLLASIILIAIRVHEGDIRVDPKRRRHRK